MSTRIGYPAHTNLIDRVARVEQQLAQVLAAQRQGRDDQDDAALLIALFGIVGGDGDFDSGDLLVRGEGDRQFQQLLDDTGAGEAPGHWLRKMRGSWVAGYELVRHGRRWRFDKLHING